MNIQEITQLIIDNQDTIIDVLKTIWQFVVNTAFGASIIVAITKTRDNKFYKLIEAVALTIWRAKHEAPKVIKK